MRVISERYIHILSNKEWSIRTRHIRVRIAVDVSVPGDSSAEQFKSGRARSSFSRDYTRGTFPYVGMDGNLCSLGNISGPFADSSSIREIKWGHVLKGNLMHLNAFRGFRAPWKLVVKLKVVRVLLRQKREDYMEAYYVYAKTRRRFVFNCLISLFLKRCTKKLHE